MTVINGRYTTNTVQKYINGVEQTRTNK